MKSENGIGLILFGYQFRKINYKFHHLKFDRVILSMIYRRKKRTKYENAYYICNEKTWKV